jgi:hypothetical protein
LWRWTPPNVAVDASLDRVLIVEALAKGADLLEAASGRRTRRTSQMHAGRRRRACIEAVVL